MCQLTNFGASNEKKVQNQNLREKLSKIGLFRNFNFWLKVKTKVKVNNYMVWVDSRIGLQRR